MQIRTLIAALLSAATAAAAGMALAADTDDAAKAAREIMATLGKEQYEQLYDVRASKFLKEKVDKDKFLTNMMIGRAPLGKLKDTKLIESAISEPNPASGYGGKVYYFDFLNTYANGTYYDRVIVVQESDGKFRLSGLMGKPAQEEQQVR
jgi:hypothetical protein